MSNIPPPPTKSNFDVIVVGGSFAGLSAALQVALAHTSVLVIDAGHPRNERAAHSHGFLTQDHKPPSEILATALQQLSAYPTAFFLPNTLVIGITNTTADSPSFEIETPNATFSGHHLIFATGYTDELPNIEGMNETWGINVFHCPFCHAYGYGKDAPLAVFATSLMAATHQAKLLTRWSKNITLFVGGGGNQEPVNLSEDVEGQILAKGIKIEKEKVAALVSSGDGKDLEYILLADGRKVSVRGVLLAPTMKLGIATLLAPLSVEVVPGFSPGQQMIKTDPLTKATSIPGISACGEIAGSMNVATSVGHGSQAGAFAVMSLIP